MALLADLRVLYHLVLKPVRGKNHADRMESFYSGQAEAYDSFRKRLLQGRQELYDQIQVPDGGVWVEMGGGTGSNLEYLGDRIHRLSKVYVVDLADSLLEVATKRAEQNGWSNVEAVSADATTWQIEGGADVVTFSYSLTMIPDWFGALENAKRLLKSNGRLGVVDFYVSRKFPAQNHAATAGLLEIFGPCGLVTIMFFPLLIMCPTCIVILIPKSFPSTGLACPTFR